MMKARVRIRLQCTRVILQMPSRMFTLAIFRVSEPYGRSSGITRRTIIPHIGPQSACLGLAVAGSKHWNRRIVGMDLRCSKNVLPDLIDEGSKQLTGCADPAG